MIQNKIILGFRFFFLYMQYRCIVNVIIMQNIMWIQLYTGQYHSLAGFDLKFQLQ